MVDRNWLRAVFATQQWKDEVLPAMVNKRNELAQRIAREEEYSGRTGVSGGLAQSVAQLDIDIAKAKSVEREIIQNHLDMSNTNPYTGFLQGINVDDNIVRQTLASEYNIIFPSSYSQEGLRQIRLLGWENAIRKGYVSDPRQTQQQFELFPQAFAESEQQNLSQTSGIVPELTWYYVKKPSGICERLNVSQKFVNQMTSQGWIFSLTDICATPPSPPPPPPLITGPPPTTLCYNVYGQKHELTQDAVNNYRNIGVSVTPCEPEPPQINDSINTNMVTQQVINFNIVNGRAVGSIKFVATSNFNPYYYGKNIVNIIQFKDPNGANILTYVKENRLNFTETERDEVINYDEDMKGNTRATVESYVWSSATQPTSFSKMYSIEISEKEPPKPLTTGFMSAGVAGAIAGLVLIGMIVDYKRG